MDNESHDKFYYYLRLMRLRRYFVIMTLVFPLILIVILKIFGLNESHVAIVVPVIVFPVSLFLGLKLLANDTCPWCKAGFFINSAGSFGDGVSLVFRKRCSSCGEPKEYPSKNQK